MSVTDKKIEKINDPRLTGYTNRTRNGATQVFYTGNDSRDWERYRADGGGQKANVVMHDKPDTINIEPPEKHLYAELINGEWWWVNGCAECNGRPRDWITYIECDQHNVCRTCAATYSELTEPPWGGKNGWQCKPCADAEHEQKKQEALDAMPTGEDYNEWDFFNNSSALCPHCRYEFESADDSDFYEPGEKTIECPRCDQELEMEVEISFSYTTRRKDAAS